MIQEEIKLLLRDLSCRLTYGVLIHIDETNEVEELYCLNIPQEGLYTRNPDNHNISSLVPIEQAKPYLRPMSSMTDEELKEFKRLKQMSVTVVMPNGVSLLKPVYIVDLEDDGDGMNYLYDWLNAKMFDYRGLIPKGLAIAVTKEYNPYEKR